MTKTWYFSAPALQKHSACRSLEKILPQLLTRLSGKRSPDQPLFGGDKVDQRALKRCLRVILPGLKFASGRGARSGTLPLITDVLSAIDHFLISGNAPSPDFTLSRLARVRTLLERALFELLVRNESPDALRMEMPEGVRREWQHMAELGLLPQRPLDQHSELLRSAEWIMDLARVEEGVT